MDLAMLLGLPAPHKVMMLTIAVLSVVFVLDATGIAPADPYADADDAAPPADADAAASGPPKA